VPSTASGLIIRAAWADTCPLHAHIKPMKRPLVAFWSAKRTQFQQQYAQFTAIN
jgi:hypothetical protein